METQMFTSIFSCGLKCVFSTETPVATPSRRGNMKGCPYFPISDSLHSLGTSLGTLPCRWTGSETLCASALGVRLTATIPKKIVPRRPSFIITSPLPLKIENRTYQALSSYLGLRVASAFPTVRLRERRQCCRDSILPAFWLSPKHNPSRCPAVPPVACRWPERAVRFSASS